MRTVRSVRAPPDIFRRDFTNGVVLLNASRQPRTVFVGEGQLGCRMPPVERDGQARWDLSLPEDDVYTIEAWWPAAPESSGWSRRVVYDVVADGAVLASATLDQSGGGDQWHTIAASALQK